MIDIKELAIGDWVRHSFYEEDMRISSIDENGRIHAGANRLSVCCHIDNFEPIPITTEILAKNGFYEASTNHWAYSTAHAMIAVETKDLGMGVRCEYGDITILTKPLYVHQLQHAIRLMGVDKEIKL